MTDELVRLNDHDREALRTASELLKPIDPYLAGRVTALAGRVPLSYRIENPSGPWRVVLDVDAYVVPDEHREPAAVAIVIDLPANETPGVELDPPDDKPAAEQVRCHLTRAQASSLMEGLRRALEEIPAG